MHTYTHIEFFDTFYESEHFFPFTGLFLPYKITLAVKQPPNHAHTRKHIYAKCRKQNFETWNNKASMCNGLENSSSGVSKAAETKKKNLK